MHRSVERLSAKRLFLTCLRLRSIPADRLPTLRHSILTVIIVGQSFSDNADTWVVKLFWVKYPVLCFPKLYQWCENQTSAQDLCQEQASLIILKFLSVKKSLTTKTSALPSLCTYWIHLKVLLISFFYSFVNRYLFFIRPWSLDSFDKKLDKWANSIQAKLTNCYHCYFRFADIQNHHVVENCCNVQMQWQYLGLPECD